MSLREETWISAHLAISPHPDGLPQWFTGRLLLCTHPPESGRPQTAGEVAAERRPQGRRPAPVLCALGYGDGADVAAWGARSRIDSNCCDGVDLLPILLPVALTASTLRNHYGLGSCASFGGNEMASVGGGCMWLVGDEEQTEARRCRKPPEFLVARRPGCWIPAHASVPGTRSRARPS
jgi:hypothetical protein